MNRTEKHKLFDKWWKKVGQHRIGGSTEEQYWDAGFDASTEWWHKRWHQDTGIPCDEASPYCPLEAFRKGVNKK